MNHSIGLRWGQGLLCLFAVFGAAVAFAGTGPVQGPDNFEPDDDPTTARWAPLFDEGLSVGRPIYRHNFDRSGDVDWMKFEVPNNLFLFVRTTALFGKANTFLSVYRYYAPGEVPPDLRRPDECLEDVLPGPNGGKLIPVACNDNYQGQRRSEVSFNVDDGNAGLFYARITYSPVLPDEDKDADKAEGEGEAPDEGDYTTYSFEASYFGVIPGTLLATVYDEVSEDPIESAIVRVQPLGMTVTENTSGVYILGALSQNTYTVNVEAPGYEPSSKSQAVSGGGIFNVQFALEPEPQQHSGDYEAPPFVLTLSELLRIIQFYNTGSYHCNPGGEDNFAPGSGSHGCPHHNADYNLADWSVSLTELLRIIQFYNSLGYYACPEGEDGFCPD